MEALCAILGVVLVIVAIIGGLAWWAGAAVVLSKAAVQEAKAGTLTWEHGIFIGFVIACLVLGLLRVLQQ